MILQDFCVFRHCIFLLLLKRRASSPWLLCDLSSLELSFHMCKRGVTARNHLACHPTSSTSVRHCEPSLQGRKDTGNPGLRKLLFLILKLFLWCSYCCCPKLVASHSGPGPPAFSCSVSLLVPESHLFQLTALWSWANNITALSLSFLICKKWVDNICLE